MRERVEQKLVFAGGESAVEKNGSGNEFIRVWKIEEDEIGSGGYKENERETGCYEQIKRR